MRVSNTTARMVAALALMQSAAAAVDHIVIKGTKFFFTNGTQFFIKGVAYQADSAAAGGTPSTDNFVDPLANAAVCARDVPYLAELGTNVIRTYAIDPAADHSACMKLLQQAGIYVISDLSEPSLSIKRDAPSWNVALFEHYKDVVDELAKYDNVIGFFAGNEVSNDINTTVASPYVKAAVRDTKAYIKQKGYRPLGVGYAANDDVNIRRDIADYFNCGPPEDAIDFWGYNIYSWCGTSSFVTSGYSAQVEFFSNYSVPVFFAEYGCNIPNGAAGRIWEETTALYSKNMTDVISGGIVYGYYEETNDYGLVTIVNNQVSTLADFGTFSTRIAAVSPSSTASSAYTPTNVPQACPPISGTWLASGNVLPPTPDDQLCQCMFSSLSCVPTTGLSLTAYPGMFGYICGQPGNPCAGISGNPTTGVYGSYVMCNATQQLGYALNQYYLSQNNVATACGFNGNATLITPQSVNSACQGPLASASAANSAAATATAPVSGTSATNAAVPGSHVTHLFSLADLAIGVYALVAAMAGACVMVL